MELNAYSGGRRHSANVQGKCTNNSGEMPWNPGDPSSDVAIHFLFLSWLQIMEYVPIIARKENYYFCGYTCRWIVKLHPFLLFYSIESYFVTMRRVFLSYFTTLSPFLGSPCKELSTCAAAYIPYRTLACRNKILNPYLLPYLTILRVKNIN